MKRIIDNITVFFRKFKIQNRLLALSLFFALIPVLIIGIYSYQNYTRSIRQKISEYAEQTTALLDRILQLELQQYSNYIDLLSTSYAEQSNLSTNQLQDIIRKDSGIPQYLRNVQILDSDGSVVCDLGYNPTDESQEEFLRAVDSASPYDCLCYSDSFSGSLVLGRKIYNLPAARTHIGYVLVYIDPRLLSAKVFNGVDFGSGSQALLITADGTILSSEEQEAGKLDSVAEKLYDNASKTPKKNSSPSFSLVHDGTEYLVVYQYSKLHGCYFAAMVANEYFTSGTRYISIGLFVLAIILFLISFTVTMLVYDSIINPIKNIEAHCNVMADSAVDEKINDNNPDEIGFLARVIDRLVAELKAMARQWKRDQARQRELELHALQYQINPHFLFNTLNSLKWVADLNDVPILSEGIESLSRLLQSTLIKKEEMIPLSQELENLHHYVSIQKIRYGNCFDVEYNIPEKLKTYLVPRFILQPLAENSIIHGTDPSGRPIRISISGQQKENDVFLYLEDDGNGFDPGALETSSAKEKFSGIGLSNVDERLKLHYGPDYGLHITSAPGKGTQCEIRLSIPTVEHISEA